MVKAENLFLANFYVRCPSLWTTGLFVYLVSINAVPSYSHHYHTLGTFCPQDILWRKNKSRGGHGGWKGCYRNQSRSTITFPPHVNEGSGESVLDDLRSVCRGSDCSARWWTHKSQKGHVLHYGMRLLSQRWAILQPAFGKGAVTDTERDARLFQGRRWNKRDTKHFGRMCSES